MKKLKITKTKKFIIIIGIFLIIIGFIYRNMEIKTYITKVFGISFLTVTTGSMMPEINIGDVIIIKECKEYEVGEIITYQMDNRYLITHRIIANDEETYITKGDNNNAKDEKIKKTQIEGKVIFHSKILGLIKKYDIQILALLLILMSIVKSLKHILR